VFENMAFGLRVRRTPRGEIVARVEEAAELLGLEQLLNRRPATLSGGQRQRVALGRAIVRRPRVFLLDEPLSNVDAKLRSEMRVELRLLQQRLGATFVYVTHDQLEAMTMADVIAVMDQGKLLQVGSPEDVYTKPASVGVAKFIGSPPMNLVPGSLEDVGSGPVAVAGPWRLPVAASIGSSPRGCTIGIHFEDLILDSGKAEVEGNVVASELLGPGRRVLVRTGMGDLGVRVDRDTSPSVGSQVGIRAVPGSFHVFENESGMRVEVAREGGPRRAGAPRGDADGPGQAGALALRTGGPGHN
jgi:ABC-type sugar transport system ATPase subunit